MPFILVNHSRVVDVRQRIAAVEHIYPALSVADDLGGKGLLHVVRGRLSGQDHAAEFQTVLQGFPRLFHGGLEPLNCSLLLEIREVFYFSQSFATQPQGFFVILKPLLPSDGPKSHSQGSRGSENRYFK
jgi:hypothetical protein